MAEELETELELVDTLEEAAVELDETLELGGEGLELEQPASVNINKLAYKAVLMGRIKELTEEASNSISICISPMCSTGLEDKCSTGGEDKLN